MTTSTAWAQDAVPAPVASRVFRRGSDYACLVNLPQDASSPLPPVPVSELIDDAWPVLWHLIERQGLSRTQPVYLFYISPRDPVEDNAACLLAFLQSLQGKRAVWAPVSTSHAAILHCLRMILPGLESVNLSSVTFLYMGDNANRRPLEAMAADCAMPFAFHALY